MSVLRSLEEKIAGLVEGTFGRVFRSEVRPVELARKLAKEMDEHRTVSVSRTYVPNEYVVWLSPQDRERYEGVEQSVIDELGAYLLEHARRERLALVSRPQIEFRTDERLALGEFGIQARLVQPAEPAARQRSGGPARRHGPHHGVLDQRPPSVGARGGRLRCRRRAPGGDRRGRRQAAGRPGRRRDHRPQPRLRHRARRLQRLPPPRRDLAQRAELADSGPRVDQRRARQRPPGRRAASAGERRSRSSSAPSASDSRSSSP